MNLRLRRRGGKVAPTHCPHCGQPLPPSIAPHVLDAARALLALPSGRGTAPDIAAVLGVRRNRAAELLRLAAQAGFVTDRGWVALPGSRRAAKSWEAVPNVIHAYDPLP